MKPLSDAPERRETQAVCEIVVVQDALHGSCQSGRVPAWHEQPGRLGLEPLTHAPDVECDDRTTTSHRLQADDSEGLVPHARQDDQA